MGLKSDQKSFLKCFNFHNQINFTSEKKKILDVKNIIFQGRFEHVRIQPKQRTVFFCDYTIFSASLSGEFPGVFL